MIRLCRPAEAEECCSIINDAAEAYRGVIAPDCWQEPYMPLAEFKQEIKAGVVFWGFEQHGQLRGIMGMQEVQDVTLFRHAYVRTAWRHQGVGTSILGHLKKLTDRPALIGTWADAVWAIRFYEKNGFKLVSWEEKERLLRKYWSIPDRQIETSVVLADEKWLNDLNTPQGGTKKSGRSTGTFLS